MIIDKGIESQYWKKVETMQNSPDRNGMAKARHCRDIALQRLYGKAFCHKNG